MLYETLKPLVGVALRWYYRSMTIAGAERLPASGPTFLAVNHPNALVDALVVACATPRRVRFTAKATIFANPVAARFFRAVGVVPLRRASDERAKGEAGRDERADAEHAGAGPAVDPARNAASFGAVADALAEGAAIVIFPEGRSHDEPRLAPLRTGLARMTRMARDERGVRGIRIVPVGLLFERKEEPRTRVLVQVGEPLDVDAFQGGTASIEAITEEVASRLAAVTLEFETADDARRIGLVGDTLGALLEPSDRIDDEPPLAATLALVRRIDRSARSLRALGDSTVDARIAHFEQRLLAFRDRLAREGIQPHDLAIDVGRAAGARFTVRETVTGALLLPLVLWGRVMHWLPLRIARTLALRNVRARDEPAMRTVAIGFFVVLLAYVVLTAIVWMLAGPLVALLFLLTLVPSATADFRYGDRLRRARARARAYLRFREDPSLQQSLLSEAGWLKREAGALEQLASSHV